MIRQIKPEGSHKNPINFKRVFSCEDNTRYLIKSDLQRRYCWTSTIIDNFFKDYYIDLFDINEEANAAGEDSWYGTIDDAIFVKKDENCIQEIVDSGQRMTTALAIVCVALFLHLGNEGISDVDERRKLYYKYIRTKRGEDFKLINTFEDSDTVPTIESMIDGTFKTSKGAIRSKIKVFSKGKKGEVTYKQFSELCYYIYTTIENTIGLNDEFLLSRLDCFLENTYFSVEECEKSERVARFKQANTSRLGVTQSDMNKSLICAKGEKIDKKFQEFEKCINEITTIDKKINILKSPLSPMEYVMRLAIIMKDETKKSCSFSYSLDNENNGIAWHLDNEKGLLYTEEKVLEYLDLCIDICEFLKSSTDFNANFGGYEDYYMLTDSRSRPYIWLYCILPCYIISKIKNEEKKRYAFYIVLMSYLVYSIKYVNNKSVQYIQQYMYGISKLMLDRIGDEFSFEDFKSSLKNEYKRVFGDFIRDELTVTVKRLSYGVSVAEGATYGILSTIEYFAQVEAGIKDPNLHNLLTMKRSKGKKSVEKYVQLDHIFPQSNKNENNETEIDSIGNLVLLEATLNESKGNDQSKTSDSYSNSTFITTRIIAKENKYGGLTLETLDKVRETSLPYTTTSERLNNFTIEDVIERRDRIADKVRVLASMDWC